MTATKGQMSFIIRACLFFCFCSFLYYILNGREQEYFLGHFGSETYARSGTCQAANCAAKQAVRREYNIPGH
jgi:hypothetical protein